MGAPPPDEAPVEEALVKQAPAPGGWRRLGRGLRRALRWLRRGLLGLLLLLVAAVGVLVGTEAGTAWAVRFGLARYAALIPGDAALGGVEGALRDGLVLRDLVLRDRAGVERLRVGALRLEWGLGSLWEGRLPVALSVAGVVLALGPGGDAAALADLAPPPGPPPPPPPPREGPVTLPLALELAVQLQDIRVTTPDGPPLLALEQLTLSATGEGAVFSAGVHRLALAAAGRRIEALRLGARWDGVEAQLAGLSVETDLGRAALAGVRFTPAELAGRLRLDAQGAAEALAPLLAERGLAALPADPTCGSRAGRMASRWISPWGWARPWIWGCSSRGRPCRGPSSS